MLCTWRRLPPPGPARASAAKRRRRDARVPPGPAGGWAGPTALWRPLPHPSVHAVTLSASAWTEWTSHLSDNDRMGSLSHLHWLKCPFTTFFLHLKQVVTPRPPGAGTSALEAVAAVAHRLSGCLESCGAPRSSGVHRDWVLMGCHRLYAKGPPVQWAQTCGPQVASARVRAPLPRPTATCSCEKAHRAADATSRGVTSPEAPRPGCRARAWLVRPRSGPRGRPRFSPVLPRHPAGEGHRGCHSPPRFSSDLTATVD